MSAYNGRYGFADAIRDEMADATPAEFIVGIVAHTLLLIGLVALFCAVVIVAWAGAIP